ncbi:MAG: hypothetical protein ACJ8GN_04980 [Longimicrobiaceae bacterium]
MEIPDEDAARLATPRSVLEYVTRGKAGRSEGCPAIEPARAQRLLPKIGNGGDGVPLLAARQAVAEPRPLGERGREWLKTDGLFRGLERFSLRSGVRRASAAAGPSPCA